jgi:hypothetical protein
LAASEKILPRMHCELFLNEDGTLFRRRTTARQKHALRKDRCVLHSRKRRVAAVAAS